MLSMIFRTNRRALRNGPRLPFRTPTGPTIFFPRLEAGIAVNQMVALRLSTLWRCVVVLSETLAWLPCRVERRLPNGGWEVAEDSPIDWMFSYQANPVMNAMDFKSTLFHHATTWGNGYAEIERNRRGEPTWMWLLTPDRVTVRTDGPDAGDGYRGMFYQVNSDTGGTYTLSPEDMIHIRGLSFDGLVGLSQVHVAARAVGLGLATEQYGAGFFENSAMPSGYLQAPTQFKADQKTKFIEYWKSITGRKQSQSTPFLEFGIEYKTIGLTNEQAQFLGTRDYQCLEICRLMGVPPHKVFKLDQAHLKNVEQQDREWYTGTLRSWMCKLECEVHSKMFGLQQQGRMRLKYHPRELLRGDIQTQTVADNTDLRSGVYTIDEIRERRGDPPISGDGGDARLIEGQRIPLDRLVNDESRMPAEPAPPTEPATPPREEPDDDESDDLSVFVDPLANMMKRMSYIKGHKDEYVAKKAASLAAPFGSLVASYAKRHGVRAIDGVRGTAIAQKIFAERWPKGLFEKQSVDESELATLAGWFARQVLEICTNENTSKADH